MNLLKLCCFCKPGQCTSFCMTCFLETHVYWLCIRQFSQKYAALQRKALVHITLTWHSSYKDSYVVICSHMLLVHPLTFKKINSTCFFLSVWAYI